MEACKMVEGGKKRFEKKRRGALQSLSMTHEPVNRPVVMGNGVAEMQFISGLGKKIQKKIRQYKKDLHAAVLPVAALLFPVILGMAALGVDAGSWLVNQRNLQNAADAAALAAAWEIARGDKSAYEEAAGKEAAHNHFNPTGSGNGMTITVTEGAGGHTTVRVDLTQNASLYFTSLFMGDVNIAAAAEAEVGVPTHEFCVLGLEQVEGSTVEVIGNVTVDSPACGIAVNSSADDALNLQGNVEINIGTVQITGDYHEQGNTSFIYETLRTNAPRTDDPYEEWEIDEYKGGCDGTESQQQISTNGTVVLSPGTYCGGLKISSNNDVIFEPGVYVMDGGDFEVTGGGTMTGDGVSFVLTSSTGTNYANLDITGGKTINFTAPDKGDEMEGVVFFQDRDAPPTGSENRILGTAAIDVDGAAYFPSQRLRFGGNASLSSTAGCVKLIARIVNFHGNPNIANNCEGSAALPIGTLYVNLTR